jgi:hypothetical protein
MTPHHNMENIVFNTKETYLAYRSEWKAKYKNLSNEIRILRAGERSRQRNVFAKLPLSEAEEGWMEAAKKICPSGCYQYQRHLRSVQAHAMLDKLAEAKLEAQRQYLQRKAALPNG